MTPTLNQSASQGDQLTSKPPLRAAQGDDDLMSQPPRTPPAGNDIHAGLWPQRVPDAAATWVRLTDADLLESAGALDPLASLVAARYAIPRAEALEQVKAFFDRY